MPDSVKFQNEEHWPGKHSTRGTPSVDRHELLIA
jgi:hypothetical protein